MLDALAGSSGTAVGKQAEVARALRPVGTARKSETSAARLEDKAEKLSQRA
jgi:hypothetical protein